MKNMELKLPNSYVEIENYEMEYIEGGVGIRNSHAKMLVNGALVLATGGAGKASIFFKGLAKKYGTRAAKTMFSKKLKQSLLRKGASAKVASQISGGVATVLTWGGVVADPAGAFVNFWDSKDARPNNGWCDFN
ncbi:MAG: hypothetical protein KH369_01325 [Paraclostridium bifermentans]|uniref:hypothetical protein n=1 Tax=Paraclostridium bifermentans TaxID=1490 RepID=UPI001D896341|nr:hypothetical protein [Paraclostridium bifermentans]MBS6506804.1 hypothetical protein [Paraclostridium bifermentans]MDU3801578.1 hypothetical protein [Paraclostridium bifermentans]